MSSYNSPTDIVPGTLARSASINNLDAAIVAAFALLPAEDNLTRGTTCYAVDTGVANAYVVDLPHIPSSYVDGLLVCFRPIHGNTGASTINVNSLGVKSIKRAGDLDTVAGDVPASLPIMIRYSSITGYFYFINSTARSASISGNEADILANAANIAQNTSDLEPLINNSIANALHRHSELVASDGSPDPALSVNADGKIIIYTARIQRNLDNSSLALVGGSDATVGAYVEVAGKDITGRKGALSFWANTAAAHVGDLDHNIIFGHYDGASSWAKRLVIDKDGKIGIGTTSPAASALLELSSTTGALLLTRMTTTQKNALTAVNGMLVYDSTLNKFQGYENGAWASLI